MPKIVVALGNPEQQYHGTRHNIAVSFAHFWCEKDGFIDSAKRWKSQTWRFESPNPDCDEDCYLVAPQTFMNLSGQAVRQAFDSLSLKLEDLLVIHDEVDLDAGTFRFKLGGQEAQHNGLLSISESLGSRDYFRLRIGIGPRPQENLSEFVLKTFSKRENEAIFPLFPQLLEGVKTWLSDGPQQTMNLFNQKRH